ncbi:putative RNA-directed DNA polymerase, eukaryota, reverse transcriptase zinc-binding domain protein [Tanacetum coccineum]
MVRMVTAQEVKEAIFSMEDVNLPVPEGTGVDFFKAFGRCKIIANRIKHSLKVLINPNQSAFIPGQSITDNILLTQELMHNYHLDRGTPRCAFKVVIQKAYDTVDWKFLRKTLHGFGFHARMIAWIMECVTTTSYSICVNGSLHGYFRGKRGLRQGDPLSPYLFTLVMEVLTLMLQRRVHESQVFTYHRYCSKLELINLCFVDDLFLFAYGDINSASIIKRRCMSLRSIGLLYLKESFWVKWIHEYKLKGMSFWDIPLRGNMSWWWRKILQLRPTIREFIWCKIGDGAATYLWYDKWCELGPLSKLITSRDMCRAGLTHNSRVMDIIQDGAWNWPHDLLSKYPILSICHVPTVANRADCLVWRNSQGADKPFSVAQVWNDIRPRDSQVEWYPSRLLEDAFKVSIVAKLVVAALTYYIWQERNWRQFKKGKRNPNQICECICASVWFKLMSCKFKKSRSGVRIPELWELPEAIFV